MHDDKYCYPNSNVLINKLGITNKQDLINAEIRLTLLRIKELESSSINGDFDFFHLKAIHKYIFQDLYDWAGKERTVEIGKGNLFCPTLHIQEYAESVFAKYHKQCLESKYDFKKFIKVFSKNYGDLNALHPFREGNGRTQREFARLVCLDCGFRFSLSHTTHQEMLNASILSFNKGDNVLFERIFSKSMFSLKNSKSNSISFDILTSDDLDEKNIQANDYGYENYNSSEQVNNEYKTKIKKMNSEISKGR